MTKLNQLYETVKRIYELLEKWDGSVAVSPLAQELPVESEPLSRKEAAEFLLVDPKTVTNWRKRRMLAAAVYDGKSPKYHIHELRRCYQWYWGRAKDG